MATGAPKRRYDGMLRLIIAVAIVVHRNPGLAPLGPRESWKERRRTTGQSWAVLLLAVVVSGGIYSGTFTVSEAASVGASVALLLAIFRRRLTRIRFLSALGDTASNLGNAMDELMRHQPSLKTAATSAIIKLLEELCMLGRDPKYICSKVASSKAGETAVVVVAAVVDGGGGW